MSTLREAPSACLPACLHAAPSCTLCFVLCAGFFASTFDRTGTRLITGEADKTIKIWKEDETATPESHPVNFKPNRGKRH